MCMVGYPALGLPITNFKTWFIVNYFAKKVNALFLLEYNVFWGW